MKYPFIKFLAILLFPLTIHSQTLDTLVDVGGYNMHFKILKGEGIPILFEAGAGNDGTVWDNILDRLHSVTRTTLITYDRSGFGKSEVNPNLKNDSEFGIENGIWELETGLSKLGFDKDIILVSHSYGGLYNLLYAENHPEKVKSIILIDATLSDFWNKELLTMRDNNVDISGIEKPSGDYFLNVNFNKTMRYVRDKRFPKNIPILNIFPETSFPGFPEILSSRWRDFHLKLGNENDNITNIIAQGSGHAVFQDNPALIIHSVVQAYSKTLKEEQQIDLLKRALENAIKLSIETKRTNRSEQDLNALGYSFLGNEEFEMALDVFKLNTILFPNSFNAFDSYGEALVKVNRITEAIEMYEKSIELNPKNENARQFLKKMKQ